MKKNLLLFLAAVLLIVSPPGAAAADEAQNAEAKLREALRNTMLQLRQAQNQIATLQADKAESDKANEDLKAKVEALGGQLSALAKQSQADKAASDKTIAGLNSQVTDQTGQISRLNQAITEWKGAYNQVTDLAHTKETERARLAAQVILLQRLVADRESKNLALFKTGNEILTRYQKFSLGEALGAKEPFVGTTRVKLETLVQDYQDKLLDQKITLGQPPATAVSGPTAPGNGLVTSGNESARPGNNPVSPAQTPAAP